MPVICIIFLLIFFSVDVFPQKNNIKIELITNDITNFWNAYDSVNANSDSSKKIYFLQQLYLKKATIGLEKFIESKKITAENLLRVIEKYPHKYDSVRKLTMSIKNYENTFIKMQSVFLKLYPALKSCKAYFFIGNLKNRGAIKDGDILISSESAISNQEPDASLIVQKNRININKPLLFVFIHEYVHIQQKYLFVDSTANILTLSIREGSADFIASLITNEIAPSLQAEYGKNHEKEIWEIFKKEIYNKELQNWLLGGTNPIFKIKDLGYFMGYAICKSYYDNAFNKQKAVKEIIELDYSNQKKVNQFFADSKYIEKWKD